MTTWSSSAKIRKKVTKNSSVALREQIQKYKNKTSGGLNFSNSAFGDPIAMSQTVPDGTELTFSITYRNDRKKS